MSPAPDPRPPPVQRFAVITGASHGIRAGLAAAFRRAGYAVVGTSRSIRCHAQRSLLIS
jgi:short-subunit dehydrogenase